MKPQDTFEALIQCGIACDRLQDAQDGMPTHLLRQTQLIQRMILSLKDDIESDGKPVRVKVCKSAFPRATQRHL
jgi:hypothetical protein